MVQHQHNQILQEYVWLNSIFLRNYQGSIVFLKLKKNFFMLNAKTENWYIKGK